MNGCGKGTGYVQPYVLNEGVQIWLYSNLARKEALEQVVLCDFKCQKMMSRVPPVSRQEATLRFGAVTCKSGKDAWCRTCNACSRTQMPWNENKSKETLLINSCYTLVVMFRVVCSRSATPNHS